MHIIDRCFQCLIVEILLGLDGPRYTIGARVGQAN